MKSNAELIMDIGMNNGDDTAYYLHKGYRVVAVDAHPGMIENARNRFRREIEDGRLILVNKGVAPERGSLTFWVCDGLSEWSSFNREIASRDGQPHHPIEVETVPLSDLTAEYGVPHYLKVDIEGYDRYCLDSLEPSHLPEYVSVERSSDELLERLHELGYRGFKCISQFTFLPLEHPPAREERRHRLLLDLLTSRRLAIRVFRKVFGWKRLRQMLESSRRDGDWEFAMGCSGPFGESTPGDWMSYGEIKRTLEEADRCKLRGEKSLFWDEKEYSFWADLHAKLKS